MWLLLDSILNVHVIQSSGLVMKLQCYSLFLSFSENKFANVLWSYI